MTAAEHKAQAEEAAAAGQYSIAQYHAAMYAAEQQRVSNAIEALKAGSSFLEAADVKSVKTASSVKRIERANTLRASIREGLGLS